MSNNESSEDFFIMDGIQSNEPVLQNAEDFAYSSLISKENTSNVLQEKVSSLTGCKNNSPSAINDVFCSTGIFSEPPPPLPNGVENNKTTTHQMSSNPKISFDELFCSAGIVEPPPPLPNGVENNKTATHQMSSNPKTSFDELFCSTGIMEPPPPLPNGVENNKTATHQMSSNPKTSFDELFCSAGIMEPPLPLPNGVENNKTTTHQMSSNPKTPFDEFFCSAGIVENEAPKKTISSLRAERFRNGVSMTTNDFTTPNLSEKPNMKVGNSTEVLDNILAEKMKKESANNDMKLNSQSNNNSRPPPNGLREVRKYSSAYKSEEELVCSSGINNNIARVKIEKLKENLKTKTNENCSCINFKESFPDREESSHLVVNKSFDDLLESVHKKSSKPIYNEGNNLKNYLGKGDDLRGSRREKSKRVKIREGSDPDICLVGEGNSKKSKTVVEHTVEDSDSDVCIVDEDIRNPNSFREKLKLRMLQVSKARNQRVLKCSECNFKTNSMVQLRVHEDAHPKGRKIKCSKCDFETRIKSCMIYHGAMHSGGKKFRCSKCSFKTNMLNLFLKHELQSFSCENCNFTCHSKKDLEHHNLYVHIKKISNDDSHLKSSIESVIKMNELENEQGNVALKKEGSLKTSSVKSQEGSKFPCIICHYVAPSMELLRRHEHTHDDFDDGKNGLTNIGKKKRKRGMKKIISREKPKNSGNSLSIFSAKDGEYQCTKCNFVTDEKLYFESHAKIHLRKDFPRKKKDIFKCSFCDFETEYERMMQGHLSTHNESDSDFDMNAEDSSIKNFTYLENQNKYNKTFNSKLSKETKKYRCADCNFTTNFSKQLSDHRSLHIRKKVFDTIFSSFL